jgi:hypothetical protein
MVSGSVKLTASFRVSFDMNSMAIQGVILSAATFVLSLLVTETSNMECQGTREKFEGTIKLSEN